MFVPGISPNEMVDELQALYELSSELICVAASDGTLRRLSQSWEAALGHGPAEMVGRPFLDFVHPDDREKTIVAATRMNERDLTEFTNRYRHKDGSWVTLAWRAKRWSGGLTFAIARVVK
jgi:PAS domain S-box-containing protein